MFLSVKGRRKVCEYGAWRCIVSPGLATARLSAIDGEPSRSRVVCVCVSWLRATRRITSGGVGCCIAR